MNAGKVLPGILVAALLAVTAATAHAAPDGIIKERMAFMKSMGQTMKVMSWMMKGEKDLDPELFAKQARMLSGQAKELPDFFPEGSLSKASEAVPAIWTKWDKFTAGATFMDEEALKMADLILQEKEINLDVKLQFSRMSSSCGQCHRKFREKK